MPILVKSAEMTVTEDNFEQGQVGEPEHVWEDGVRGPFPDYITAIRSFVVDTPCVPHGREYWAVRSDKIGQIEAEWQVDAENTIPSTRQVEEWKKGQTKLYDARLVVRVVRIQVLDDNCEKIASELGVELI